MATIVNITATFCVKGPVKIPHTAKYKYYLTKKSQDIMKFPGAIYKKYGHTFIIFESGKIVCVGGKNLDILETICKKVAKIIHGISRIYDFEIKNLVGCLSVSSFVDMDMTAESIKSKNIRICYDPELMAAIYAYTKHCLVIIFHTGKINFTGAKSENNIKEGWKVIEPCLKWR